MKLNFYMDAGHGWLKVPRKLVDSLGISVKISTYSYQMKESVYLEEDCDMPLFIDAMTANDKTVDFNYHHCKGSSKVRSYNRYQS